eukprot:174601-Pelagomonas_calceolata.AAC.2
MNKLANPLLPPSASAALVPSSTAGNTYVGGSLNVIAPSPLTHVAVAVEAKGGLSDPKAEAAAAVGVGGTVAARLCNGGWIADGAG